MKSHADNPSRNAVLPGTKEDALIEAISSSGYPLQGIVADALIHDFHVIEEWGFVDDETKQHRSLDLYAFKPLDQANKKKKNTGLILLVECKRSRHPFVFFQQVVQRTAPMFPHISGVPQREVAIHARTGDRSIRAWPAVALGLDKLPFIQPGPPICAAFSKAAVNGNKVELSGSESFNTIMLPLVKAFRHSESQRRTPGVNEVIFPTMIICVAVLDAPMILVESPQSATDPVLQPWVRVIRHESHKESSPYYHSRFYTVDFVHTDYFEIFTKHQLLPFAQAFAERMARNENVLRFGGTVGDLDKWNWDEIKAKAAPR